jgi:hypothetical protein
VFFCKNGKAIDILLFFAYTTSVDKEPSFMNAEPELKPIIVRVMESLKLWEKVTSAPGCRSAFFPFCRGEVDFDGYYGITSASRQLFAAHKIHPERNLYSRITPVDVNKLGLPVLEKIDRRLQAVLCSPEHAPKEESREELSLS